MSSINDDVAPAAGAPASLTNLAGDTGGGAPENVVGHAWAESSFRRSVVITLLLQGAALLSFAVFTVLAARWLGASGRGLQALLVSAGQLLALVLGFGFAYTIPYAVASDRRRAYYAARAQLVLLAVASGILIAAALANQVTATASSVRGYEGLLISFVLAGIAQPVFATLALSLGRVWASNLSTLIANLFALAVIVAARLSDRVTVEAVVGAQAIGFCAGFVFLLVVCGPSLSRLPRPGLLRTHKSYRRVAFLGFVSGVFILVMTRADIFLLTALGGSLATAGVYSIAVFSAELVLKLPQWVALVLAPLSAGSPHAARDRTAILFWGIVTCAAVLSAVAIAAQGPLSQALELAFGHVFAAAYPALIACLPRVVFQSGGAILAANLAGRGYTLYHPLATGVGVVAMVLADIALVPRFGAVGAGLGGSIASAAMLLVLAVGYLKLNKMTLNEFLAFYPDWFQPFIRGGRVGPGRS